MPSAVVGFVAAILSLTGGQAAAPTYATAVAPKPDDNIAAPCRYDLTLPAGRRTVRAVWVTYDRGRDITKFYSDADVSAFARRHDLALLLAHQCPAKDAPGGPGEMDMDPSHGIGRALFTALDQLAVESEHAELANAKLILLGFSGTGALFAHFVGFAPARIVAAILAAPGHYDPVGVDRVALSSEALGVPELVITGGADKVSGTQRPYDYFRAYRERHAPWTLVVQNRTPHCCVINTKPLVLEWLDQILALRRPTLGRPLHPIDATRGLEGYVRECASDVRDSWGGLTWNVCDARVQRVGRASPPQMTSAGWMPSARFAQHWQAFISMPTHPTDSPP